MGFSFGNPAPVIKENVIHIDHLTCTRLDESWKQPRGKCHMYWDHNFKFRIQADKLLALQEEWNPMFYEMIRSVGTEKIVLVRKSDDLTAPGYFRIYDENGSPILFAEARRKNLEASEASVMLRLATRPMIREDY